MIVSDLIAGSLRLLGLYGAGDPVETEDLNDGLTALNEMLNSWNAQHLAVYTIVPRSHALTGGTGTYTIGDGGTFAVPRPVKIECAGIVRGNGLRYPLKLDTSYDFHQIVERTAQARLPLRLYYDNDFPLGTLKLWPIPSQNCTLDLNTWDELSDALTLDDDIDLPPSYQRAIRYNLAVTLSSEYGKGMQPDQTVIAIAQQSKAELAGLNASNHAGTQDPPMPMAA
jgi:hypothetical protein